MIDGHGDDIYHYGDSIRYNFSSNISQDIDHSALKKHIASCLDVIANYPEPEPYTVQRLISERLRLPVSSVMVTNGAVEAIHILSRLYEGRCSAVLQPTFSEYADACRLSHHTVKSFGDMDSIPAEADIIWICNPNNPTGKVYDVQLLKDIISKNPDKIFIVDQAYHKYTEHQVLSPVDIHRYDNLILLYSMTKDYAVPGLRLGYIIANDVVIASLSHYRVPWSVNALAIEAAKFLLTHTEIRIDLDTIIFEVERVSSAFIEMGISVLQTDTNFMLCELPRSTSRELKEYLVKSHNILIRDASNFEMLTTRHFRIAVQSPSENNALITGIKQWMQS